MWLPAVGQPYVVARRGATAHQGDHTGSPLQNQTDDPCGRP